MVAIPKLLLLWTVFYFVVFALPALFAPGSFVKATEKLVKNEELVRLAAIVAMIFGFLYLLVYVNLDGTRYMVFSIMGYLSLLKGVVHLWFPKMAAKKAKMFWGSKGSAMVTGIVMLLLAVFLLRAALIKF